MLLEVDNVYLSYGSVEVVHGVSLQVSEGQFVALLGRNGAGKSTLIESVTGLHPPGAGSIRLDGEDCRGLRADQLVRRGLSTALGRRIFQRQSVGNNLMLGAYSGHRDRSATAASFEMVQKLFPVLGRKVSDPAASLSGGEQQMLAIGQALMARPRLLLLDEPSAGLAPRLVEDVFTALEGLRDQGLSMLIVEQSVDQTLKLCDHAYLMDRGSISLEGRAREIRNNSDVRGVYIGEFGEQAGE
jgi:branched-chain amino acid transport system ATP-binding protein